MKSMVYLTLCLLCDAAIAAEHIPLFVERTEARVVQQLTGGCEEIGGKLNCQLVETTITAATPACKVRSYAYSVTLDRQGPETWGSFTATPICNATNSITLEVAPTPTKMDWPGVLKYTSRLTATKEENSDACKAQMDYTERYEKIDPNNRKRLRCDTVEFNF